MKDEPLDRLGKDGFLAERMPFYAVLYPKLREVARQRGYALALHGSLAKDLDVLAVPWVLEAAPADVLVKDLVEASGGMLQPDSPVITQMPHGRMAVTIMLGGQGGYVDLSIMPLHGPAAITKTK